jgi:DNA polymerase elongation subunit (family B)
MQRRFFWYDLYERGPRLMIFVCKDVTNKRVELVYERRGPHRQIIHNSVNSFLVEFRLNKGPCWLNVLLNEHRKIVSFSVAEQQQQQDLPQFDVLYIARDHVRVNQSKEEPLPPNERSALSCVQAKIRRIKPDIIVVFNATYVQERARAHSLGHVFGHESLVVDVAKFEEDVEDVVSFTRQLTVIAGNTWRETLQDGRAVMHRVEMLLAHLFFPSLPSRANIEMPVCGGRLLPVKTGLYNETYTMLLDFRSTYPSIIREFQLCYMSPPLLPGLMETLMQRRQQATDPIVAKAIKLTTNSIYGCMASKHSRFYNPSLAGEITKHGRDILWDSYKIVRELGFDVLFGHTDGLCVDTGVLVSEPVEKVNQIGEELMKALNRFKVIQIKVDCIFRSMWIIHTNRYAGYRLGDNELVLKGVCAIRSDFDPQIKKVLVQAIRDRLDNKKPSFPQINNPVLQRQLSMGRRELGEEEEDGHSG